jgi:hypothetical protein
MASEFMDSLSSVRQTPIELSFKKLMSTTKTHRLLWLCKVGMLPWGNSRYCVLLKVTRQEGTELGFSKSVCKGDLLSNGPKKASLTARRGLRPEVKQEAAG